MACSLTMTLISEQQVGNCGEDWKYDLDVRVLHEGLKGQGHIHVPRHNLRSGETREPFGTPEPQVVYCGECLTELLVRVRLTATEVDLFINDVGKSTQELVIACPAPGRDKVVKEIDISADVHESPRFLSRKRADFTVRLRFALVCDSV